MSNKTNIEENIKMLKELDTGDDIEFKHSIENITLAVLFEKRGSIATKKQLSLDLYNQKPDECRDMCIRDLIKRLRIKLKGEVEIRTRRGLGYYIFNS